LDGRRTNVDSNQVLSFGCHPVASLLLAENSNSVCEAETQGFEDLPFRIDTAPEALLDAIDRQHRDVRTTGQLCFGQHVLDADLADVVRPRPRLGGLLGPLLGFFGRTLDSLAARRPGGRGRCDVANLFVVGPHRFENEGASRMTRDAAPAYARNPEASSNYTYIIGNLCVIATPLLTPVRAGPGAVCSRLGCQRTPRD